MFAQKGTILISVPVLVLLFAVAVVFYYLGSLNAVKFFASDQQSNSTDSAQVSASDTPSPTAKPALTPPPSQSVIPSSEPTTAPKTSSNNNSDSTKPTSIKVTSPNGGESFKVGDTLTITWDSNNLTKSGSCVVTLRYEDGSKSKAWFPVNTPQGSDDWTLPAETAGKKAKLHMECYDSNQTRVEDTSDNFFSISLI